MESGVWSSKEQQLRFLAQIKTIRLLQRDQVVPLVLLDATQGEAPDTPVAPQNELIAQAVAHCADASEQLETAIKAHHLQDPAKRRVPWEGAKLLLEDYVCSR